MQEDTQNQPTQEEPPDQAPRAPEPIQDAPPAEPAGEEDSVPQADDAEADDTEADDAEESEELEDTGLDEDGLPKYTFAFEDVGTLKKKITVTVPVERIDGKRNEMFGELSQSAQIPGFRVGRAPRRLIEKRFGREITQDVRNALVGDSLGKLEDETELKTIGQPDLKLDDIELPETGPMEFSFEVEVAPKFELPELKGIRVERQTFEVDDARIDEQLENWRAAYAKYEGTDDPAGEGDMVVAHVTVQGEGIEPIERPGQELRVAPGQIEGIPLVELGKELTGKKAGDEVTLPVDVSEAHPNEAWRGKKVEVKLALTETRHRVLPALDDEFAARYGLESMAELRTLLGQSLKARVEQEARGRMRAQVEEHLLAHTDLDVPEGAANRHAVRVLQRRYVDLLQRGIPRERIDEHLTELQAAATQEAVRRMKLEFILGEIAEQQEIEVADEEVNARVAMMAQQYNRRPERVRQELEADGSIEAVVSSLREEKTLEFLLDQAEIVEVAPAGADEEAPEDQPAKKAGKKAKKAAKAEPAKEDQPDAGDESEEPKEE